MWQLMGEDTLPAPAGATSPQGVPGGLVLPSLEDESGAETQNAAPEGTAESIRLTKDDLDGYMRIGEREHVRNQKKRILLAGDSPILTRPGEIIQFIHDSVLGKVSNVIKGYGRVNGRLADAVSAATQGKTSIGGYYLELDANRLAHLSDHINDDGDGRNISLTSEQAEHLPEYIDSYDDLIDVIKRKDGSTRLMLGKKINGHSIIIEAVSKGRRALHPVTAYQVDSEKYDRDYKSRAIDRSSTSYAPDSAQQVDISRQAIAPDNNSIPQPGGTVNTGSFGDEVMRQLMGETNTETGGASNGRAAENETGDRGGRRLAPERAGERTGRESGRRSAGQGQTALDRRRRAAGVRLEEVSGRDFDIASALDRKTMRVMPEALYDDELRDVSERVFALTGLRPTFVLGTIEHRRSDGSIGRARGAYNGSYLVIQCDSATATATQLGLHESWHDMTRHEPGMIRATEERIRAQYDTEQFARVVDIYINKLAGTVNFSENMTEDEYERALDALLDEIFADAYAGINAFGANAARYLETARQVAGEYRGERAGNAAAMDRTTGPPEQYSIDPDFADNIDIWDEEGRPEGEIFILGSTGPVLQGLGAIESDIYMNGDKIAQILNEHPEMTLDTIKRIPELLEDPVLILKSKGADRKGQNTRLPIFGSVKAENGQPVMAVLDLRPVEGHLVVDDMQKVSSAYTKKNAIEFLKSSDILHADKKRTIPLLRTMGLQSRPIELLRNGSIGSISYKGQNVNIVGVPFSSVVRDANAAEGLSLPTMEEETSFSAEDDEEYIPQSAAEYEQIQAYEALNRAKPGDHSLTI